MISVLLRVVEEYKKAKERKRKKREQGKHQQEEKHQQERKKRGKLKIYGLKIAGYIVAMVEQLMLWVMAIFGFTGMIAIIFGVFIVAFLMDALAPNEYLIKEEWMMTTQAEGGEGMGRPAELQFTEEELALYGQYWTEYEKNLFRVGVLLKQSINGYGSSYQATEILGQENEAAMFRVMYGLQSVETGWAMFSNPADKETKSVYSHPAMVGNEGRYHGPYQVDKSYTLDGMARLLPADMRQTIKQKYPKPGGTPDVNFYPYASAMSVAHLYGKKAEQTIETPARLTNYIDNLAPAYGVTSDLETFKLDVIPLMLQIAYLSWHPNETEGLAAFFLGVWAMSSDNPSERSFSNYQITYEEGLDLSTANHQLIQGVSSNGRWSTKTVGHRGGFRGLEFGKKKNITLNGQPLTKPLSRLVVEKYWDKPGMQKYNSQATAYSHRGSQFVVKGLYGIESYLVGDMLIRYLTEKVPLVAEGGDGGFLEGKGFLEAKQGVIQGDWPADVKSKMMARGSNWVNTYGTARGVQTPNDSLPGSGMTFEEWRVWSKWKVPWYSQTGTIPEPSANVSYGPINRGNGCHVFMSAYIASALTGRLISFGEMMAALIATGGVDGRGYYMNARADNTFKHLGINWAGVTKSGQLVQGAVPDPVFASLKGSAKEKVDAVLAMDGIVGVSTFTTPLLRTNGHYYVITEKVGDKYRIYSTTTPSIDVKEWTWDQVVGSGGSSLRTMADGSCFFLAYNPNIQSMKTGGGKKGSVVGGGDLKSLGIKRMPDLPNIRSRQNGGVRGEKDVKRIVIHYTGHGGATERTAQSYYDWLKKDTRYNLGAQFYLDSKEILQVTPLNWITNHTMGANRDTIGLEVSNVLYEGKYYYKKAAIENAVKLTRALMKEYNLTDVDKVVVRHYDAGYRWGGKREYKNCPAPMVNARYGQAETQVHPAWIAFKDAVRTGKIDWKRMAPAVDPRDR